MRTVIGCGAMGDCVASGMPARGGRSHCPIRCARENGLELGDFGGMEIADFDGGDDHREGFLRL